MGTRCTALRAPVDGGLTLFVDQTRRLTVLSLQQGAIHPIGDEHVGGQAIEWNVLDVGFALGPLERTVACSAGPYEPMFSGRPLSFGGRAFWSRAQSRHTRGIRAVLTDTHVSIPIETR